MHKDFLTLSKTLNIQKILVFKLNYAKYTDEFSENCNAHERTNTCVIDIHLR